MKINSSDRLGLDYTNVDCTSLYYDYESNSLVDIDLVLLNNNQVDLDMFNNNLDLFFGDWSNLTILKNESLILTNEYVSIANDTTGTNVWYMLDFPFYSISKLTELYCYFDISLDGVPVNYTNIDGKLNFGATEKNLYKFMIRLSDTTSDVLYLYFDTTTNKIIELDSTTDLTDGTNWNQASSIEYLTSTNNTLKSAINVWLTNNRFNYSEERISLVFFAKSDTAATGYGIAYNSIRLHYESTIIMQYNKFFTGTPIDTTSLVHANIELYNINMSGHFGDNEIDIEDTPIKKYYAFSNGTPNKWNNIKESTSSYVQNNKLVPGELVGNNIFYGLVNPQKINIYCKYVFENNASIYDDFEIFNKSKFNLDYIVFLIKKNCMFSNNNTTVANQQISEHTTYFLESTVNDTTTIEYDFPGMLIINTDTFTKTYIDTITVFAQDITNSLNINELSIDIVDYKNKSDIIIDLNKTTLDDDYNLENIQIIILYYDNFNFNQKSVQLRKINFTKRLPENKLLFALDSPIVKLIDIRFII